MSAFRQSKKVSIIVEGNIGAGKSTFLKLLSSALDIQPVFEPHDKWQNIGGENLLENFYQDTQRWAYSFQTYAFVSRVIEQENFLEKSKNNNLVLERSVYSDRYCFAKNAFEMGVMTELEWELYKKWFEWLVTGYTIKPTGFIYLQTDPEVCYKRLIKRARSEEKTVRLDYLKKLHSKHEDWLVNKVNIADYLKDLPVLVLNCNKEFENDFVEQSRHFSEISKFFGIDSKIKLTPKVNSTSVSL